MVTIAFHDNQLCERGTTAAVYDYARFNEEILGNRSIVLYDALHPANVPEVVEKFKSRFKVLSYENWQREVPGILLDHKCDLLYMQKGGERDGKVVNQEICPSVVHCVFDIHQPHGTVYGRISPVVGKHTRSNYTIDLVDKVLEQIKGFPRIHKKIQKNLRNNYPMVPYIVNLPKVEGNLRSKLSIPEEATVFGRIGGKDQFNIKNVHKAIDRLTSENPNVYFLLANTDKFCSERHNIIHYPQITCVEEKIRLIQSCDAMIHAREMGETFGLAVAEFSSLNKPVLTCKSGDVEHVRILGDKAILYDHKKVDSIYETLKSFDKKKCVGKDWNAYRPYSPSAVMKVFNEKFIQPCLT